MRPPNKRYSRLVQQLTHLINTAEDTFNAVELADLAAYIEDDLLPHVANLAWDATLVAERAAEHR